MHDYKTAVPMMDPTAAKLRLKKPEKVAEFHDELLNNEAWKPDNIVCTLKKNTFELVDTKNPGEKIITTKFFAALLFSKQVWLDPKDPSKGTDKIEKRVVTLLRASNGIAPDSPHHLVGRQYPEQIWFPNTAIANVGAAIKKAKEMFGLPGTHVLYAVTLEVVNSKGNTWNKPILTPVRPLTEAELAYISPLVGIFKERADRFGSDVEEANSFEAETFGTTIRNVAPTAPVEEVEAATADTRRRDIDEDEPPTEEEIKAAAKALRKAEKAKAAAEAEAAEKAKAEAAEKAKAEAAEKAKAEATTPPPADEDDDDDERAVAAAAAAAGFEDEDEDL